MSHPYLAQKFKRGDLVYVKKITESYKSHFDSEFEAIILASYFDLYFNEPVDEYLIVAVDTGNISSWYEEEDLILQGHRDERFTREVILKRLS